MIKQPFEQCGKKIEGIEPEWKDIYFSVYEPFNPDATAVCNALHTEWETIPGYNVYGCSECKYDATDLNSCAKHIHFMQPEIEDNKDCTNEIKKFQALNWTAYCHYERSFHKKGTSIPFLGGLDVDFDTMCTSSNYVLNTMPCEVDIELSLIHI